MTGTDQKNSTQAARGRSGPVLYEIVSREGIVQPGGFTTASRAFEYASRLWPDQEQDEDRTGKGWDVQVVGCDQ